MKKIILLAGINSIHTTRWANVLADFGYNIYLVTQHKGGDYLNNKVKVVNLPFSGKFGYYLNGFFLKKIIRKIKPDLLHSHYASGYGTLGRLSNFHPYLLSVWGSDVYDFPYESKCKMKILKKNLRAADCIASTSRVMERQIKKISNCLCEIEITPFGVDENIFKPENKKNSTESIKIGTIKKLSYKYGIDVLIKGFAEAKKNIEKFDIRKAANLRLIIVGDGIDRIMLQNLAFSQNISSVTEFVGVVEHSRVSEYLNKLDIYVAASRLDSESFGVAVLEASACGLPVIVSNVGGLPEIVRNNVTGKIIENENFKELAKVLEELILNKKERQRMGSNGILHVKENYSWRECVLKMDSLYKKIISPK